ncbi:MAG: hypothetical protein ABW221_20615 [Vicinamibacteria bacterium]
MKTAALCLVLAVSSYGCRRGAAADVKVYAVVSVGATPMLMYTAVYRADPRDQTVRWWVEGVQGDPMALENCTVRDALNWRCQDPGEGATSGKAMADGRYSVFGVSASDTEGWKFLTEPEWKALEARQK